MYCSRCGQAIGAQPVCANCGASTGVVPEVPPVSRVARHLHTLGVLWVVFAVYSALRWVLVLPFLHAFLGGGEAWMSGPAVWTYVPFHPGNGLLAFISAMVLGRAVLALGVGIALLTRQSWGRILAIVMAIVMLFKPVLGTALGIFTLWVLAGRNADRDYGQLAAASEFGVGGPGPTGN